MNHLIHLAVYPPDPGLNFRPFLAVFWAAKPRCTQVPHLRERLTIYQLEHELNQLLWSQGSAESLRIPRLVTWMEGVLDDTLDPLVH